MQTLVRCLSGATVGAALSVSLLGTAFAAEAAMACQPLSGVQQRVVDKAYQGVDALRGYLFATRGIHALDMIEDVAPKLEAWRARSACAEATANAAAALDRQPRVAASF